GALRNGALRLVLDVESSAPLTVSSQRYEGGREWRVLLSSAAVPGPAPARSMSALPGVTATAPESVAAAPSARGIATAHGPRGEHEVVVAIDAGHGGVDPGASGR